VTTRIAVLDDYIGCAEEFGDWGSLGADADVSFHREAIPPERLVEALADYEIVVITQQRTWLTRQVALVEALASDRIAGAGLDVFDREPLLPDHPLRSLENAVVMPHMGYVTESGFRFAFGRMAEDVAAFLRGDPIRVVD
jgi:phosphoglycerate dehydrogenase-like enzyme